MGVIASVRCLILVVAGGADGVVPAEQSRPHEAAPTPKRYVEVPDADTTTSLCTPATRSSAESWPSCPDATRPADAPLRQSAASAEAARGPVGTVAG